MPRKQRFYLAGVPAHVMQRGHNRSPVFFAEQDYREYLKILKRVADQQACDIHAYVLMTNHIHLLLTPSAQESIGLLFQALGRQYVTYINKTYQRSGSLWGGRHKGNIIDSENYFLTCMLYIELNPVRAGIAAHLSEYPWSSYSANAFDEPNAILTPHSEYLLLAKEKSERLRVYRELFESTIGVDALRDLRMSLQSGTPLGSQHFKQKIESALGRKAGYMGQGRPPQSS